MSLADDAVAAAETVTGARWWRLALKLAPWLAIAGLAAALFVTRTTLARVKLEHAAELARNDAAAARQVAANAERGRQAADTYATRTAALQPLIVRSTDTVRTYAQTDAGRALCRDADRVRDIDALDAALAAADPAGGGAGAVPVDPAAPPAGR